VAEYRAFTVGTDGHFVGFEPIVCDDDASAIERANRLLKDHDIELWSRGRMVVRLTAKETGAVTHEIRDGCLKPKR
jgi:hypothetical protein